MMQIRRSAERGHAHHGWLRSKHTYSFANYYDPRFLGFRALRVINEDRVAPGAGFPRHPHRDMEILSYVVEGALEHADTLGTGSIIRPGEVQRMSAGRGIAHSEYNHSREEPVHFLQIWIEPGERSLEPSYEQKDFPPSEKTDRLRLVASPDGREGSITIHQDAELRVALLSPGAEVRHALRPGRGAWLQVVRGAVKLGDETLEAGDGAAVEDESELVITGAAGEPHAEILLFDLA